MAGQYVSLLASLLLLVVKATARPVAAGDALPRLSRERLVFQTDHGDIHMAFYPDVAPKSAQHIRRLGELGAYNTNHFFRVDRGFVAQTADVLGGRTAPLDTLQKEVASRHVPLEVVKGVKHDRRGVLSMARHDDPNSGGSSFSILLGPAPHLDMQYSIFGEVTQGLETLAAMERVETRKEGIFIMPKERITIQSTYVYMAEEDSHGTADGSEEQLVCTEALTELQGRFDAQSERLEKLRAGSLPGN